MKSFKEFAKDEKIEQETIERPTQDEVKSAEQLTKSIASAYHGKSNADMWKSIVAEAEKSRRAGTLTDEEIDRFYQTFSPMLDSSQRKKLRIVVEKLKKM